jgi:cell division protein FtsZ
MDDDALIALLEDFPTYNRDPKVISQYKQKSGNEVQSTDVQTSDNLSNSVSQNSETNE